MSQFIKANAVKKYVKEKGRRTGKDFLAALDDHIKHKLDVAARTHNGGKLTLDATLAVFVGIK